MQLAKLSAVVAFVAGTASATIVERDVLAMMPLQIRQEPGSPQFNCHAACGGVIAGGRQPGYCENAEWTANYQACLECANTFSIWTIYGGSVTRAATGCGLTPVPSPSGSTAPSTSAAPPAPASTTSTTAPSTTSAAPTTAAPATTTSAAPTPSNGTAPPPVTVSGSSALGNSIGLVLLVGSAFAVFLSM